MNPRQFIRHSTVLLFVVGVLAGSPVLLAQINDSGFDSTHLHIANETQLFVDNWIIESAQGVTRRWHKPVRHGNKPVLEKDKPWEIFPYFSYADYQVLRDSKDKLFKCWYEDGGLEKAGDWRNSHSRVLYAESRDGIHWEKPELDIVRHKGKPTNIVGGYAMPGEESSDKNPWPKRKIHGQVVIIDPNPPSPEYRFRMIFFPLGCAHSADGKHWIPDAEPPNFGSSTHLGDVITLWYDNDSRDFVMNTRKGIMARTATPETHPRLKQFTRPYAPRRPDLMNLRRIYQTRSHDFIHWSDPVPILTPMDDFDNIDDEYYGMGQFQVGRMHFGTLGIFRKADNERDVRLVFSRDGVRWCHADRGTPFFTPSGGKNWDAHMVSIVPAPIEVGDELYFFHGSTAGHHDYWLGGREKLDHPEARDISLTRFAMGLATLRRDGFASLDTGDVRPGVLSTRPVSSPGTTLFINARCREGGSIRVTLTDINGKTLEGCELEKCDVFTGDNVRHKVTWQGRDTIPAAGSFRRIVVHLKKAEIFSFRFDGGKASGKGPAQDEP
ncbi:MAG: hypothetical protein FJ395_18085 [Verrucomicrobia bacterium]|nr:hypothetical protein [Verrucomicrobiota bacterium]